MNDYKAVMARKKDIMLKGLGLDYSVYEQGPISFAYEKMMDDVGYSLNEIKNIQAETGVGSTPLLEMKNLTALARKISQPGKGARIFLKDEAANPSGSFKARRAALSVFQAQRLGYRGVITATSGNYGAAVASQAAMRGLKCIVVQEVFDSRGIGQPEILEKGRACEAYGAEVVQLSVGPELFYVFLRLLEETGYFSASLYTPYAIAGIETLGSEIAADVKKRCGCAPDAVIVTHAGGGNVTGTARGLQKAGCTETEIIGVCVDLSGLHMASDHDFNRKSFTTGHSGFGIPFATWPDRTDVPRNAARPLRCLDRLVTVTQGEVFYMTELLAKLEGLERGPAGNTSLAAAFALAQTMDSNQIIVVQETEYTGAGKHPMSQLTFARENGIEVRLGDPRHNMPGKAIVIPEHPTQLHVTDIPLNGIRESLIKNSLKASGKNILEQSEVAFLSADTGTGEDFVLNVLKQQGISIV